MVDKLEDSLNGGYLGLYGEVVTSDCYRLKSLSFIPDVIFDLGANVGVFTRYARELFPNALIVAVEPHKENAEVFEKFTPPENIVLIKKAIGKGAIWHATTAANGSGECYFSEGLGYPQHEVVQSGLEKLDIETMMPDELINKYLHDHNKSVLKLDIEGAENIIWDHDLSMEAIKKIDYICGEIHFYAINGKEWDDVQIKTRAALKSLEDTHLCELDNVNFWAVKK
jgi:FkbM family methyltransferase